MAAAVKWIAGAPPSKGGVALAALAAVFDVDTPSLRERAVRVAVKLAPHTAEPAREAIREAATRLPWWRTNWRHPFEARTLVYGVAGFAEDIASLLSRCALAIVSPANGRELTAMLNDDSSRWPSSEPAPQQFVQRRFREVMSLFERGETIPVLLATPTSPSGHVDAATLVARMERLDGVEPLEADFLQALLRLPRQIDPELVVRAEKLPSEAGRRLAACATAGCPTPS
ncbi:hypothetical protein ACIBLB_27980 [Streptosporangium canum]|uniref:hypothetical protein n=1 Tax=Streptosporangium canum TaxID=324952 RepID=UPI0037A16998